MTVTERDLESGSQTTRIYRDGLLESNTVVNADNGTEETRFVYSDGSLIYTSHTDAYGKTSVEYYLRNPSNLSLFAVRQFEDTVLVGQSYLYDEGNIYHWTGTMTVSGDFEVSEQGNVTYTRNGTIYTYSPDSRLLMEESEQGVTEYSYSDGELTEVSVTTEDGRKVVTTRYTDSLPVFETTVMDNAVTQTIEYNGESEGMIKTVYAKGIPVARVYYMADNRRVLRVEYL